MASSWKPNFLAVAAAAAMSQLTASHAQHASDNPVTSAEDAYGLTLGLESIGLYGPGQVRGFSPHAAGNVRIDGMYFDEQGGLSNRVIEGSTIRVGVSEIGYAFPAPTGIVDYDLRHPGDEPGATIIAKAGPFEARGISIDGSLPLIGHELLLPIGVSSEVSTETPYGPYPGLTSRVTSVGATPQWSPNGKITVRALFDWQQTRDAKTLPLYFTSGNFLPPRIPRGFLGQDWAQGRSVTLTLGGLVSAQLTGDWSLRAGLFHSVNDNPSGFADLYTGVQRDGQSEHFVIGYPDQNASSTSGEVRLTDRFTTGDWHQELIFMARGRDTTARYGGEDIVDFGSALIVRKAQVPEPDFRFSMRATDRSELWSIGTAYHADWRGIGELELGIQEENYRKAVTSPSGSVSEVTARPLRAYGNAAFAVTPRLTLYAGFTQGLEDSGVAPSSAQNRGAVLPASKTWQIDSGLRYVVTPELKIIAGVFELQKPYFNLDTNNIDRELGAQRATGLEFSIAGQLLAHLDVNVGILAGKVSISGSNLAAEGVGPVAVGQPRLTYSANVNYSVPWWPAVSLDASAVHYGSVPASVDNGIYTPAVTQVNLGGRYKFTAFGENNTLRVQIQNALDSSWWSNVYTPGFFQWPPPRTVFVYLTTDLQG
jgi:iron complex outermembrane receptor protein